MFGCHKILNMIKKLIMRRKTGPAKSIIRKHIAYLRGDVYEDLECIRDRLVEHYAAYLQGVYEDLDAKDYEKALKKLAVAKAYLNDAEKFANKLLGVVKD